MKTNKSGVVFLLIAAGAIALVLSGCNCSRFHGMHVVRAASDSGSVSIHKMGGDIEVAEAPHGANLVTMGGNIHLDNVESFAKARTMGGEIVIKHANASIDASSMGGGITISDANGPIKASTMGGDILAKMVGSSSGRRDIELSSKGGSIELTVPKDFPMEIRITLAYTKNATRRFDIVDHIGHLGLNQQESSEWDSSHGTPRKYIRASGHAGSGQNRVTIDTINGDVILKQE